MRGTAALPPERSPTASVLQRRRTNRRIRSFQLKRKNGGGKFKNYSRDGFSGGARVGLPAQAARLKSVFCAKIGLDFVVEIHQYELNYF